jgi:RNA polymerase sigma-70 factor, ECF subfamily
MEFCADATLGVPYRRSGPVVIAPLGDLSDEALLLQYIRGDEAAFVHLVRRYERPLFTFALRYLKAREPAREATQETFLRVVRRSREFRQNARFGTWIFSILRNLCIDELRRAKHRRHASIDDDRGAPGAPLVDRLPATGPAADPERALRSAVIQRDIESALGTLPPEQLEVFLLREIAGLPFREIAVATDTPENTVKSRMRYALERLQQALLHHDDSAKASR